MDATTTPQPEGDQPAAIPEPAQPRKQSPPFDWLKIARIAAFPVGSFLVLLSFAWFLTRLRTLPVLGLSFVSLISDAANYLPLLPLLAGYAILAWIASDPDAGQPAVLVRKGSFFLANWIGGGFAVFLLVMYVQPRPFFISVPGESWWAALSVLVALVFGVLAVVYFRERELHAMRSELDTLRQTSQDLGAITFMIMQSQNPEGASLDEHWKNILSEVRRRRIREVFGARGLRMLSSVAWEQGSVQSVVELRQMAYDMNAADPLNLVFLSNAQVESGVPSVGYDYLNKRFEVIDPAGTAGRQAYAMSRAVLAKLRMQEKRFAGAATLYGEAFANDDHRWYQLLQGMCQICSHQGLSDDVLASIRTMAEEGTVASDQDAVSIRLFAGMLLGLHADAEMTSFWPRLSVLEILSLPLFSPYDRVYLPNVYAALRADPVRRDAGRMDAYLLVYHAMGLADREADDEIKQAACRSRLSRRLYAVWDAAEPVHAAPAAV